MAEAVKPLTGAEKIKWDLSDLYQSPEDPKIDEDMAKALKMAEDFAEKYRGRVASLSAAEMKEALQATEDIISIVYNIMTFARMSWTVDTQDPILGKNLAKAQEFATKLHQATLFFDLEWADAPDEATAIMDDPVLNHYRYYLAKIRLYQPHTLSEPEEKVISELGLSGVQAWQRYFGELMSSIRFPFDGEELTQSEILTVKFRDADRDVRKRAADSITTTMQKNSHATTFVFNMILLDKASKDRMRDYTTWISERNLANEVDDDTVDALINAVTGRYDLVSRYYVLLKKLLGFDTLYDYDRYAPLEKKDRDVTWDEARHIVLDAFGQFDQRVADITAEFFDRKWIDAALASHKRGGAYCNMGSARHHPYVFMNFVGNSDSVMTLAHELGHGMHGYLAREQGELLNGTPLTTAEMASTFGEMLVFDYLMERESDPAIRLSMRMERIMDTFGTVYRQIAMNRFEHAIHNTRRERGELTTDEISQMWLDTQSAMYGDSVVLREDYGIWWSYIPHFLNVPGYVYAYAFGELLVWALYARYQKGSNGFADRYLDVLKAGGSNYPHEILAPMEIDLRDPNFWHEGLGLLEGFIAETENDAVALNGGE